MDDRFTLDQLRRLGHHDYCSMHDTCFSFAHPDFVPDDITFCSEEFKSILDTYIRSFVDGSLPNFVCPEVSESAPDAVKAFFASFTTQSISTLLSAPDDDTAFDTLIPRNSEFSEYRDYARNLIHKYSEEYKSKTTS